MAANHLFRGILESSKMVPTVAENCLRQSRHLNRVETKPKPRWDVHFGGLEDDGEDSSAPHVTFRT